MRDIIRAQMQLGECDIAAIEFDCFSRDDIPRLLRGLQHIYTTEALREEVFAILADVLPVRADGEEFVSADTGRPGMSQWRILVLGTLRLGLNADFDRAQELANQHRLVRQMLGHSDWADEYRYGLQTIKDNLRLFTPEVLERINAVVVKAGHDLVKPHPDAPLEARCDSVVVETNVHFPTDINLLLDAVRKAIEISASLCADHGLTDWRQSAYNIRCLRKLYRRLQQLKRSTSKDEAKRAARLEDIHAAYRAYLEQAEQFLARAKDTRYKLAVFCHVPAEQFTLLDDCIAYAELLIDQIERRVLQGERIPHEEKVFSIFEPHTEWIAKGKAGTPVELGVRVAISEDQFGFILHHRVMFGETDDQVAVPIATRLSACYPRIKSLSFDKGFHSPSNQKQLAEVIDFPVLPKKGKCNAAELEREQDPEFRRRKRQHSAVESAINALEAHGLDRCPDHGEEGFERYVALAVLGRNIHRLGAVLIARDAEAERQRRKRERLKRAA
ncbi:ISNCY family transposase [Thiorhodovibrio litoralis]|uniref:ISNCY family transposase n=1 Tax=Thiorhodovibrio litoralis TaxID=2952932 RepID=UPI002B2626E7|nr:ISNCY family transposase [Thiorhodovibrio litoralis]WPL14013.1 hypothetical protein Thiosp_03842 [Thiorhodovibrio litoralis]